MIRSTGIRPAQWRLYWEDLADITVRLPSLQRQRAITVFLDKETSRINALVAKKRRLLSTLNEKRIALITAVVTGQLKVPGAAGRIRGTNSSHTGWPTAPLGRLASINARTLADTTDPDYTFRYLDISSVGRGEVVEQPKTLRFEDAPSRARRVLRRGDTIISTVRTYLRAVLPIREDATDLIASTGFAVLSPRPGLDYRFLSWYAQANPFVEEVVARSVGVSYPAIAPSELAHFHIPTPTLVEQRAIADFLDTGTARINDIVETMHGQIDLLEEHRQALISAAVTEQIEIPKVAA